MTYYRMYPSLYVGRSFLKSEPIHWTLPEMTFDTLDLACQMAKLSHVCLREENWFLYKCETGLFFDSKRRIPLMTLYNMGFLKLETKSDFIGSYYEWK